MYGTPMDVSVSPAPTKLERLVLALAALLVAILIAEEIPRILYPWDMVIFSESAFLTDMMKLTDGQPVYTSPGDVNSFPYAPGLQYLAYGLLRPFGLQLDIRFCRLVTALVGVACALVVGGLVVRVAREMRAVRSRSVYLLASTIAGMMIFKSYTADAPHPDNLYALHAMAVLALTIAAVDTGSFRVALVAALVAGVAVMVKQTGIFGVFGALAVMIYLRRRDWGLARSVLLVAWGCAWLAVAAWVVFHGWGKYWALELPSHHDVHYFKIHRLVAMVLGVPHRAILFFGFAPSLLYVALRATDRTKKFLLVWAAVGLTEVMPSLASYFKAYGSWNNLTIVDLWAAIPEIAVVAQVLWPATEDERAPAKRAIIGGTLVTLLVTLLPTRSPPSHKQYEFGRALDATVAEGKKSGKPVLVTFGASTLVHNGLGVPLDRAGSASERLLGGFNKFPEMTARLEGRYYGMICYFGPHAPQLPADEVEAALTANYHLEKTIEGDGLSIYDWDLLGNQAQMQNGARVFVPNP